MAAEWIKQEGRALADLVEAYKDKILMIVFHAGWCPPCRRLLSEVLPTVAKQAGEGVAICLADVQAACNHDVPSKHRVKNVPATLFFSRGREVRRITGLEEPEEFLHAVNCHQKKKANL